MKRKRLFPILMLLGLPAAAVARDTTPTDSIAPQGDFSSRVAPVVTRVGTSFIANAVLTEVLKASIHEWRPDGSDNNSWPSRHTSWATTVSAIVARELYTRSAWWALGAHAFTDIVAMQRCYSRAHHPKDVLGGMAIGVASTGLGYFLSELIYPSPRREAAIPAVAEFMPSLDVTTMALFPTSGGAAGISMHTAINTSLRASLPLAEYWGVTAAVNFRSIPCHSGGRYLSTLDGAGLAAGVVGYVPLPSRRWSLEGRVMPGFMGNFHGDGVPHPRVSFTVDVTAGAAYAVTPTLSLGVEAGYCYQATRRAMSAPGCGVFTRISF